MRISDFYYDLPINAVKVSEEEKEPSQLIYETIG